MNARDAAGENRGRRGGQLRRGELAFPRPQHGQGDGVRHVQMFFFSSRRRPTRSTRDWSSDVCSSDLKGTGLGLTVAYAIVQEHGGRIRLESPPNRGASFYVELPVTGPKLPPAPVRRVSFDAPAESEIGRASWRERGEDTVGAVPRQNG